MIASQVELAAGFVGSRSICEAPSQKLFVAASHGFEADENDHNPAAALLVVVPFQIERAKLYGNKTSVKC